MRKIVSVLCISYLPMELLGLIVVSIEFSKMFQYLENLSLCILLRKIRLVSANFGVEI